MALRNTASVLRNVQTARGGAPPIMTSTLLSCEGKYLAAEQNGEPKWNRDEAQGWENWTIEKHLDKVTRGLHTP